MQIVMEGSKTATEQQLTGELLKTLTIIGLVSTAIVILLYRDALATYLC